MSKLLDTKQIAHIAAELMVLAGLAIYFNQKQRRMMTEINKMAEMIEKQNEKIKIQSSQINMLMSSFETINMKVGNDLVVPAPTMGPKFGHADYIVNNHILPVRKKVHTESPLKAPYKDKLIKDPVVSFSNNVDALEHVEESESEDDEDLDASMVQELKELEEDVGDVEDDNST